MTKDENGFVEAAETPLAACLAPVMVPIQGRLPASIVHWVPLHMETSSSCGSKAPVIVVETPTLPGSS